MVESDSGIKFKCTEIYSHVVKNPFVVFFLSCPTRPRSVTLNDTQKETTELKLNEKINSLSLVGQMYFKRQNDNDETVSQYLGSFVVDLSQVEDKEYSFVVRDSSSRKPLRTGQVSMQISVDNSLELKHVEYQHEKFSKEMYNAAESNLTLIGGFSPKGLDSVVPGLKWVHSPYYVNHMGMTLPSGAFCMIPTTLEDEFTKAVRSHKERLTIALSRNCIREKDWINNIHEMLDTTIKSKHLRSLSVVADAMTLHARLEINYTPDVQITPESKGTERWSIPREPTENSKFSFTGDCEDFAREVYQQCKEIREWVKPGKDSTMGTLSMILHMYVPTIEQGAVDSSAHSKYIKYDAPYRNHIWSALHPRNAWASKMYGSCSMENSYNAFPKQKCETTLPMLHLEGTGDVYPVVTTRKPGYIMKMQHKMTDIYRDYPSVMFMNKPDMSLQCEHKSNFYKYAIAFMTDVFKDQGMLDYTYVNGQKYGVSIYDWARGQYNFAPSTKHKTETMDQLKQMIGLERPIGAITTKSSIVRKPKFDTGYYLRFGQNTPIEDDLDEKNLIIAEYKIGQHSWHEVYFKVDESRGSSSEIELR